MNSHSNNGFEPRDSGETPAELRPIEAALDAVAEADRESAPTRLEQGVFLASWRNLGERNLGEAPEPVIARVGPMFSRWRIAAAAAVGIVALIFVGRSLVNTGGAQLALANGLEDDVNFVLDLRSSSDDLATLGERIDTLFLDTTSVGDSLKSDATTILLGDGAL